MPPHTPIQNFTLTDLAILGKVERLIKLHALCRLILIYHSASMKSHQVVNQNLLQIDKRA